MSSSTVMKKVALGRRIREAVRADSKRRVTWRLTQSEARPVGSRCTPWLLHTWERKAQGCTRTGKKKKEGGKSNNENRREVRRKR